MRIAVAGGTGAVGVHVVEVARAAGHEVVALSRASGHDLVAGTGLAAALEGAAVVVDVSNTGGRTKAASVSFFEAATRNLLAAETAAGVGHHVVLSIVGIDRVPLGYYQGKLRQEELVAAGAVPWTTLRATQFHEFPGQLLAGAKGPIAVVPRMRSATVAAREVAAHLLALATGDPQGVALELAGPEVHDMPDLVRRVSRAQGLRALVLPVRPPGRLGREWAGGGLLPQGDGPRGALTFDDWLAEQR